MLYKLVQVLVQGTRRIDLLVNCHLTRLVLTLDWMTLGVLDGVGGGWLSTPTMFLATFSFPPL